MEKRLEKLIELIRETFEIEKEIKITEKTEFYSDLGVDSLEQYELTYAIEEKFGIKIPDEKFNEFETVGDYTRYLDKRVKD